MLVDLGGDVVPSIAGNPVNVELSGNFSDAEFKWTASTDGILHIQEFLNYGTINGYDVSSAIDTINGITIPMKTGDYVSIYNLGDKLTSVFFPVEP